jgi:hypothetical protein
MLGSTVGVAAKWRVHRQATLHFALRCTPVGGSVEQLYYICQEQQRLLSCVWWVQQATAVCTDVRGGWVVSLVAHALVQ